MKDFAIRIQNGKPTCIVVGQKKATTILQLVREVLSPASVAEAAALEAFMKCAGYEPDKDNLCGDEPYRLLSTSRFWTEEEDVLIAHARITTALQAADDAVKEFVGSILPDGDYTVSSGVVRL